MENKYKIIDGTHFHTETPETVCNILNRAIRNNSIKLRIFYGDTETGRDWNELSDTFGFIGRSTGQVKIPLMIHSNRSMGGPGIFDHCIVRITIDKVDVYRHPSYCCGIERKGTEIYNDKGFRIIRAKDEKSAIRWYGFLNGKRNIL